MKTKFDPERHHRRSILLKGYDYSQEGAYYVTIVTYQRDCIFGDVIQPPFPAEAYVNLSNLGKIADECWCSIPEHFPFVELGAYVIMPNHVHGIIIITDNRRGTIYRAPTGNIEQFGKPVEGSLPAIVRTYKAAVTRLVGRKHNTTGIRQRNYYEHIIRDEKDLQNKTDYINANPSLWDEDDDNPRNVNTQKT